MFTFLFEPKNAAFIGCKKDPHFGLSLSVPNIEGQLNTVAFFFKKWQSLRNSAMTDLINFPLDKKLINGCFCIACVFVVHCLCLSLQ